MRRTLAICVIGAALLGLSTSCDSATVQDPEGTMTMSLLAGTPSFIELFRGRETGPDQSWPFVSLRMAIPDYSMNFTPNAVSALDTAITQYYIRGGTGAELASVGEMSGLGAVVDKPASGWAMTTAVELNHGYVVRFKRSYDVTAPGLQYTYCRMYVEQLLLNGTGGMIGAKVKYQMPF